MKNITPILSLVILLTISPTVYAGDRSEFRLPEPRTEKDEINLGFAIDPETGAVVEGRAMIRYWVEPSHRSGQPAKPPKPQSSTCYKILGDGAKWKTAEPWIVNPTNSKGLAPDVVMDNVATGIAKWEDAANGAINDGVSIDIHAGGDTTGDTLIADSSAPDGQNEVYFGTPSIRGAVAITVVWGIFWGPKANRMIVEWDQIYGNDIDWSASGEASKMDFESVSTHELGHSAGMGDLYKNSCSQQTMYGYVFPGETHKRSLDIGDLTGISRLYK